MLMRGSDQRERRNHIIRLSIEIRDVVKNHSLRIDDPDRVVTEHPQEQLFVFAVKTGNDLRAS